MGSWQKLCFRCLHVCCGLKPVQFTYDGLEVKNADESHKLEAYEDALVEYIGEHRAELEADFRKIELWRSCLYRRLGTGDVQATPNARRSLDVSPEDISPNHHSQREVSQLETLLEQV
jgi:hypothetical protein